VFPFAVSVPTKCCSTIDPKNSSVRVEKMGNRRAELERDVDWKAAGGVIDSTSTGSVIAVVEVWWLRNGARVRGPTPAQTASMTSFGLAMGSRIGVRTYRAPKSRQTCSHVRSSASYSRSVERTSSPGLQCQRPGGDVHSRRCVRDEHQIVRIRRPRKHRAPPGPLRAARPAGGRETAPVAVRARAATPGTSRRLRAASLRTSRGSETSHSDRGGTPPAGGCRPTPLVP
jgi:hypothetical protein